MFNEKKFFFSLIILSGSFCNLKSENLNSEDQTQVQDIEVNIEDGMGELDLIDELIEAPKNPDAKPSEYKIPSFIREYGMRMLEMFFYVKNGIKNKYRQLVTQVKYIYYRNSKEA